jgi:uncharacterized repeat protein (TIGR03987 family)
MPSSSTFEAPKDDCTRPWARKDDLMLALAVIWMMLALIFYTWAVFSGRRQGLHRKHLIIFGVGLVCDFLGTHQMNLIAAAYGKAPEWHNVAGIASLSGMAFHFLLALIAS